VNGHTNWYAWYTTDGRTDRQTDGQKVTERLSRQGSNSLPKAVQRVSERRSDYTATILQRLGVEIIHGIYDVISRFYNIN
jgi:hypothetical protein